MLGHNKKGTVNNPISYKNIQYNINIENMTRVLVEKYDIIELLK